MGEDGKGVSSSCTGCSCKPAEKTVLVEIDTWTRKQKANETNYPCRSGKKVLSKRIPNPLKLWIQGHPGKMRQAGLSDGRPGCPGPSLGNGPRSLPKEKSRSSRRRILCSHLHASTPTISEHGQSFQRVKSFPIASYPISFLPPL